MSLIKNESQSQNLLNKQFNNICITCRKTLDQTKQFSINLPLPRINPPITFFEVLKEHITYFGSLSINQVPQNACQACFINVVGFLCFQTVCNKTVDSIKRYERQNLFQLELYSDCITCMEQLDQDQTKQFSIHKLLPKFNPPITFFEGLKQIVPRFAQLSINKVPQNACDACLVNTVEYLCFDTVCKKAVDKWLEECPTSSTLQDPFLANDINNSLDTTSTNESQVISVADNSGVTAIDTSNIETEPKEQRINMQQDEQSEHVESRKETDKEDSDSTKLPEECSSSSGEQDVLDKNWDAANESHDIPTASDEESAAKEQSSLSSEESADQSDDQNSKRGEEKKIPAKRHLCAVCGKTFEKQGILRNHEQVHNEGLNSKCPHCGKGFKGNYNLGLHIKRMHQEDKQKTKRRHLCSVCGKTFDTRSSLIHHGDVHNMNHGYSCPHCEKEFKGKYYMNQHISRMHREKLSETSTTSYKPNTCEICDIAFANYGQYRWHYEKMHGKKYDCVECGKQFHQKFILLRHMVTHTDIHSFQCSFCGKLFKLKDGKTIHEARHCRVRKAGKEDIADEENEEVDEESEEVDEENEEVDESEENEDVDEEVDESEENEVVN